MSEIKQCEEELSKYPSFFEARQYTEKTAFVKICLQKIFDELELGYEEEIEYIWACNAISFFAILLKDNAKAQMFNDKALKCNENDVIALANRGWLNFHSEDFFECREVCKRLEQMKQTEVEEIYAKAQIAYLYSKLGIAAYSKSVEYFTEILEKEDIVKIPESHFLIWNYRFGLIRKRMLNIFNYAQIRNDSLHEQDFEEALKPHLINMSRTQSTSKYRARSIVSIGELVYSLEHMKGKNFERLKERHNLKSSMKYIHEALKIGSEDYYVLYICGKHFRYAKNIEQSIRCLKDSLSKRDTSFAHHHIAISLRRNLEKTRTPPKQLCQGKNAPRKYHAIEEENCELNPDAAEFVPRNKANITSAEGYKGPLVSKVISKELHTQTLQGATRAKQSESPVRIVNKKRMMKSPRHVILLEINPTTDEILYHLDEAVKRGTNLPALYEKGLVYRSINQLENAKETFQKVKKHPDVTPVLLTNAYEQCAYCLLDGLENSANVEKDKENAIIYLKTAIGIQCNEIVNNNPDLKEAWFGTPTLKDILSCKVKSKKTIKHLADLYEMIKEYRAAVKFCFKLIEFDSDSEGNIETYERIVKMCIEDKDITEAQLAMDMIKMLPNWSEKMDPDLYIQVQIEGGIKSYLSEEYLLAKTRFENAIRCGKDSKKQEFPLECEDDDKTKTFDILILSHSFETEGVTVNLLNLLKTVGINATANDVDILHGKVVVNVMEKIIKECERFIVVCDSPEEKSFDFTRFFDFIERGNHERFRNKIVVVKSSESLKLEMTLHKYPLIVACSGVKQTNTKQPFDSDTIQWMKELLLTLLCRK